MWPLENNHRWFLLLRNAELIPEIVMTVIKLTQTVG